MYLHQVFNGYFGSVEEKWNFTLIGSMFTGSLRRYYAKVKY